MKGVKRFAMSDSNSDVKNPIFQSKRVMVGSPFDAHRAESSAQQSIATPQLDMQRAESSRQHVRALNKQFASWIQAQLQNHPDELWEDGVQDYLTHATNIMEKYSDVVNWLKANASKAEDLAVVGSNAALNKHVPETKASETKLFPEKTGNTPATTGLFGSSWNSGFLLNNQTPFSFGTQSSILSNNDASNNVDDGEDEAEQPGSPSVKKTEEKGVIVVHEVKCKLYVKVKSNDPADKGAWKDKGSGQLSIKCKEGISKGTKESKPTIVVRNDVGKVLLNAFLYPGIKTNMQKNSVVAIFHTSGNEGSNDNVVAQTFLLRTKTEDDRNKLAEAIQDYAPVP